MEKKSPSLEAAKKLNELLLDKEEVKAYQRYETAIKEHPEIAQSEEKLKAMQKQMVLNKAKDVDDEALITDYEKKKAFFDEHPLVVNYRNLKEEVDDLLLEVETMINNGINDDMD
jgi:cell fate (sporulation/competence/biofilm development) regulator YmcA (YheA/YmcA/DUF963 family)